MHDNFTTIAHRKQLLNKWERNDIKIQKGNGSVWSFMNSIMAMIWTKERYIKFWLFPAFVDTISTFNHNRNGNDIWTIYSTSNVQIECGGEKTVSCLWSVHMPRRYHALSTFKFYLPRRTMTRSGQMFWTAVRDKLSGSAQATENIF